MPDVKESMQGANEMEEALTDALRNLVETIVGRPSKGKGGEPLSKVCFQILPIGESINPRDFADPWDPAGSNIEVSSAKGDTASAAPDSANAEAAPAAQAPSQPAVSDEVAKAMAAAFKTSDWFNRLLYVTDDGTYAKNTGGTLSTAYEGIITKAQGVPAPPLPPELQKRLDDASKLLWEKDKNGKPTPTQVYKDYQTYRNKYAEAEADYANEYAAAMNDATLGRVWPVTSKGLRAKVQNAYDNWRSSGADDIENALEIMKSVGGSIGNHFLSQARSLYETWGKLGLAGAVAAEIPYTYVMPSTWYDPLDEENGFTTIKASSSSYRSNSHSHSAQAASNWLSGHRSKTGASAGFSIGFFSVGGRGAHSSAEQHSESSASQSQESDFATSMSNVSITMSYGLCTIFRPWLLRELFAIDGWYLPGQKAHVVSDGTIPGQKGADDTHLLPMIPTQFLVVRNLRIEAKGWGKAGQQMSDYCKHAKDDSESSSTSGGGSVGIFGFGGGVSHEVADWKSSDTSSSNAERSWNFKMVGDTGILTINGCQIVGYIGEIVPASPKLDGTAQTASTAQAGAAAGGTASGTGTPDGGAKAATPPTGAGTPTAASTPAPAVPPQGGAAPGSSAPPR